MTHSRPPQPREVARALALADRLAELETMTVSQLQETYLDVFGHATDVRNRRHLIHKIGFRMQEREEGGLQGWVRRRLKELSEHAPVRQRQHATDPAYQQAKATMAKAKRTRDPRLPPPGTILRRRTEDGVEHRVEVLDAGCRYEGVAYKTLSAAANAITGKHVNGYRWFGLGSPKKATKAAEKGRGNSKGGRR